ncbi:hypothetical protein C2E20_2208 [Micractinium conductrix]|uniref:Uncharacterized protein n=1 Tax=Micractinium conductrix TaxID=554055 RepID=A0A2P6VKA4_9CHLO|nr:hypothetical protein C2E20_2208 [Micractinium conductrix]|eukprot:PSC74523.1 hypothetical protein C2E20_2208 [Micractinium conductrix]
MHDAAVALSPQATCLACTLWAQAVGGLLAPAILLHPASGGEHEQQQQQEREQGGAQAGGGWMDLWRESPLVTLFFSSNVLWILLRTACVLHLPNPTTAAAE